LSQEEDILDAPSQPVIEEEITDDALDINGNPVPSEEVEVNHFDKFLGNIDPAVTENRDALLDNLDDATVEMTTGPVRVSDYELIQMKNEQLSNYGHEPIPVDSYVESPSMTTEQDGPVLNNLMLMHE